MARIDFNRLRFLVIDDNAHMRRILRTLLHGFGAREVYEAEDGAAGLEAFTHYVPDIVLTDWVMPIFDGLELAQMIRQPGANANPYVPIILLTGHSEKKRVVIGARRRRHRVSRQADIRQVALRADPQRGRQSASVHQEQNLFRTGPAAQRQSELCRPGAAQRRQGGGHTPAAAARQGQGLGLTVGASIAMAHRKDDTPSVATYADHEVITPPHELRKAVALAPDARRRSGRARRSGAGRALVRVRRMDAIRMRASRSGAPGRHAARLYREDPRRRCSAPPTTSKARLRRSAIPQSPASPKACAGSSNTRPRSSASR